MDGNLSIRTDPWFNEGFAEYFSSIEVDNKEARVGKIPELTYRILEQTGLMKVKDLLRVQQNTKTYNESGDHRTSFYATSSLLMHYLFDNKLVARTGIYYDAMQAEKLPFEQALQKAFGMTPDQLDKALRNYLNSGGFRYYPVATPPHIVAAQFTVSPVSQTDARALIADIHAHSPDHRAKAMTEFQEVLQLDPANEPALRGMGYLHFQQGNAQLAREYFQKAVARDSKDARVHFFYAMLLNRGGVRSEERDADVMKELETAIALDPNFAEPYSILGYQQAMSGKYDKAVETMKKGIELAPREDRYQLNLANVYMMARKVDDGIAIFKVLTESADQNVALQANDQLVQAQRYKALINQPGEAHVETTPEGSRLTVTLDSEENETSVADAGPSPAVHFKKGKVMSEDCSGAPEAIMTMDFEKKTVKLHVRDTARVVLIGADDFSCSWKGQKMQVNYRDRKDGDGDVISLEVE